MSGARSFSAWVELARASNLPTCLSNVLVGCAIATPSGALPPRIVAAAGAATMLLYAGGTALNDVMDHRFDRATRPQRPIPSGRVSLRAAAVFAAVCLSLGLSIFGALGRSALGLAEILIAAIIAYDLLHKRYAFSAVLMGACRGLVYLAAAASIAWPPEWVTAATLSAALFAYVTVLTLTAQTETHRPGARRFLPLLLPAIALVPVAVLGTPHPWWSAAAGAGMVAWLAGGARRAMRPAGTVPAVLAALSGISLVDAFFLTLLSRPEAALLAAGCFALTAIGHRRILGT